MCAHPPAPYTFSSADLYIEAYLATMRHTARISAPSTPAGYHLGP